MVKQMHANIDVEKSILVNILKNIEEDYKQEIFELSEDDFSDQNLKNIFIGIKSLVNKGHDTIDFYLLATEIEKLELPFDKTIQVLGELYTDVPPIPRNMKYHIQTLKEYSQKRNLIDKTKNLLSYVSSPAFDNSDIISEIEKLKTEIVESDSFANKSRTRVMEDVAVNYVNELINKVNFYKKNNEPVVGVLSGFKPLDEITNGFQKSDLIIVAGRPGMGKTSFGLACLANAAKLNYNVAFFSLEMSSEQLLQRLLSGNAKISQKKLRTGKVTEDEYMKIADSISEISTYPVYLNDKPAITLNEIKQECMMLKSQNKLDIIFVDYLQIMGTNNKYNTNREQQISEISRGLKAIAKEFNVPVIALAQVNRNVEKSADKRPKMSDLRESGAIEQDADIIMFLYRDEVYDENSQMQDIAEIIIEKHRNGESGTAFVKFDKQFTLFNAEEDVDQEMAKVLKNNTSLMRDTKEERKQQKKELPDFVIKMRNEKFKEYEIDI